MSYTTCNCNTKIGNNISKKKKLKSLTIENMKYNRNNMNEMHKKKTSSSKKWIYQKREKNVKQWHFNEMEKWNNEASKEYFASFFFNPYIAQNKEKK